MSPVRLALLVAGLAFATSSAGVAEVGDEEGTYVTRALASEQVALLVLDLEDDQGNKAELVGLLGKGIRSRSTEVSPATFEHDYMLDLVWCALGECHVIQTAAELHAGDSRRIHVLWQDPILGVHGDVILNLEKWANYIVPSRTERHTSLGCVPGSGTRFAIVSKYAWSGGGFLDNVNASPSGTVGDWSVVERDEPELDAPIVAGLGNMRLEATWKTGVC